VDVLKSNAVYAEVPNVWFFDNGLDIAENGILRQDPDEDEYDNLDEFMQGTDPNDGTSRPDLAMKLEVTDVIEKKWLLQVAAELNGECKFKFKSDDVPEEIKTKNYVGTGGYIFEEVLGQRFIYKEVREVEVEKFGSIRKENVYVVFDAKRGSELVLPRRIKTNDLSGYERKDQFATRFLYHITMIRQVITFSPLSALIKAFLI